MKRSLTLSTATLLFAGVIFIWQSPPTDFLSSESKPLAELGGSDSFMHGVDTVLYSPDGSVKAEIRAAESTFFRDQQTAKISLVEVNSRNSEGKWMKLTSSTGLYDEQLSELELLGSVEVVLHYNEHPTTLRGEQFNYQLLGQKLTSEQPLVVKSQQGELSGEGLEAHLDKQLLIIDGRVRGRHQP